MSQLISHSVNPSDAVLLQQLDQKLEQLTQNQKAALAITALYEATEPENVCLDYQLEGFGLFTESAELILCLSTSSKLAVARTIAEELAVIEQLEARR